MLLWILELSAFAIPPIRLTGPISLLFASRDPGTPHLPRLQPPNSAGRRRSNFKPDDPRPEPYPFGEERIAESELPRSFALDIKGVREGSWHGVDIDHTKKGSQS